MIKISDKVLKKQKNFWNDALFHPTDAVEDSWGKRIIDRFAEDKSVNTIRIYAMLEDIVYEDMEGNLCYDFRLNDLRLDYLTEKGFDVLIAYAAMPDCIAKRTDLGTSNSFHGTRYKGKMFNTSPPKDYALWEEVCYQYTKHIVERYGIDTVSKWRLQCWNEPDNVGYLMCDIPRNNETFPLRANEYGKLYEGFVKGALRVSDKLTLGGPTIANHVGFLKLWLNFVKEKNLRLDFIALHNYGTGPNAMEDGTRPPCIDNHFERQKEYADCINGAGFKGVPIVLDEWGLATRGFSNCTQFPSLICRETELFSAYFVKLIHAFIHSEYEMDKLMICLSGQHEMTENFTGFRNFFTMDFIAKPIYNSYVLASKLKEDILDYSTDNKNLAVIPTRDGEGNIALLLSYANKYFTEEVESITEELTFEENLKGKKLTVWCIDKTHTNPYRLFQKKGMTEPLSGEEIKLLREEGKLKPIFEGEYDGNALKLKLTPNSAYLVTVS